jgi:hypothetical protein
MKKFIINFAILAFIFIGLCSVSKASIPIDFHVIIIADSCSGTWTGDYCVQVYILHGSTHYCVYTECGLTVGVDKEISYSCTNLNSIDSNPDYSICIKVCRNEIHPTCCGSNCANGLYIGEISDGSQTIPVILH